MKYETLSKLFVTRPSVEREIEKAAGYAVFSNVETKILFAGAGSGYGVAVDNATGKETYMRMAKVHGGFGVGVQDFRAVFVFKRQETLRRFIDEGWQFGAGADVALKSQDKGAAASVEVAAELDPVIYQLTEAGVALSATVAGTKYWKSPDLH
jgi:lipid-binding SYLF domain-containing protein